MQNLLSKSLLCIGLTGLQKYKLFYYNITDIGQYLVMILIWIKQNYHKHSNIIISYLLVN
jgi:hypothetical protein